MSGLSPSESATSQSVLANCSHATIERVEHKADHLVRRHIAEAVNLPQGTIAY